MKWACACAVAAMRPLQLIMHGTADQDRPVEHSQRTAAELSRLGRTHRLLPFEGQQHRIGGRGADRDAAAIEWFRRFGGGECPFDNANMRGPISSLHAAASLRAR